MMTHAKRTEVLARATPVAVLILVGNNNYGKPRQAFADKIAALSDEGFSAEAEKRIWLSAYAHNNPRSDYHWQSDACLDEAGRRGKPELYKHALAEAMGRCTVGLE